MAKVCPSNGHADKSEDSGMAERPTTQDSHARERLIGSRIASDGPGDDNVTRAAGIRSDLPNDRDKILAGIADQPFLRMAVRLERVLGMRLTAMRAPAAARTRATMRSSMPHASNGTSEYSLPKTVMPIFFSPIGVPAAAMTPRSQGLLPVATDGFASAFGDCFLIAGVAAGGAGVPDAGCASAHADDTMHDRTTAAAKYRTMEYSGRKRTVEAVRRMKSGDCGSLKLKRVQGVRNKDLAGSDHRTAFAFFQR